MKSKSEIITTMIVAGVFAWVFIDFTLDDTRGTAMENIMTLIGGVGLAMMAVHNLFQLVKRWIE